MDTTIPESETKQLLQKINEHKGPMGLYSARLMIRGDWDRKNRVIKYLNNMGFIDYDSDTYPTNCMVTKHGLKLIEIKKEADKVNIGKTEDLKERENEILKHLEENPWLNTKEIAEQFPGVTKDAIYQNLSTMVEDETIQVKKAGRINVYAVFDEELTSAETPVIEEPEPDVEDEIGVKVTDITPESPNRATPEIQIDETVSGRIIKELVMEPRPEGQLVTILTPYSTQIIVNPKQDESEIVAIFSGQEEIINAYTTLPVPVQNSTLMTMIPEDNEYNLNIRVEIPSSK